MQTPAIPPDEAERLAALRSYAILDTEPEAAYDDLVRVASHLLGVPMALVSLVDAERQWFKARLGLDATEGPRELSFCGHAVAEGRSLVVPDARQDPRFHDNPAVVGPPHVRFYAGAPLRTPAGHVLGTLCAIDHEPRTLGPEQLGLLEALARQAVSLLELRRRAAEAEANTAALHDLSKIQRRFFELSLDLLCIAGTDGYFKRLNPTWTKLLGHPEEELLSRPWLDFVHPDDQEATLREGSKLAAGHETIAFENRYRTHDGGWRWLMWSVSPDPESGLLMAVARDVTPLKEAEQRLREAQLAADAANRAKSDFLANMSHELRTPLNSVIGFTNILLKNKSGNLGVRELDYLNRIGTNGNHLLRLINDVLDLSRIEAGRIDVVSEEVDLAVLVHRVVSHLQAQAQAAGARLGVTMPERLVSLRTDQHRLEQVVINLVGNALKFTTEGTVEVRIRADAEGHPVRIDVIDDGVGIPTSKHAVIFESFRQADESTRRRFGGTGLGLAISRSLCEALGFRLDLASTEGRGSLFAISLGEHDLPLAYEPPRRFNGGEEVAVRTPELMPEPAAKERSTVLVIDDDADARAVLENFLQDYGCQIVAADSGERGIELARQLRPDLVTLDLVMPDMDGWAVLETMREDPQLCSIPVVICSIVGDESKARLSGAIAVMDKPVEREELYAVLREHLADPSRRTPIEDVLAQVLGPRRPR
jgi:PAS domain S-box-containing protein